MSLQPEHYQRLLEIVAALRAPDGCPWDRKQTPESMRKHLIEETYETIDAINENDHEHVCEELGDLLMLVSLIGQMYAEQDIFTMEDVCERVNEKLVRRHPHVFGNVSVGSADEVVQQWNQIKRDKEGRVEPGLLDSVQRGLPALERAHKLQRKASDVGFDWPTLQGVVEKIHEELAEVQDAIRVRSGGERFEQGRSTEEIHQPDVEREIGDLLFSVVNLARYMEVDPAIALNRTNTAFVNRFRHVENLARDSGRELQEHTITELEAYWQDAKHKAQ